MDGVHDLGGTDGFGPVEHAPAEPTFHAEWEGRVFAAALTTMAQGSYTMDAFRHAIERMDPVRYLSTSYYEHWLVAVERLLVEEGVVDPPEVTARIEAFEAGRATVPDRQDPELASSMRTLIETGGSTERESREPAFAEGDEVRVRNRHPRGHTRCPGYVRRAPGTVTARHGTHVLPDANAHGDGEQPEPLYAVRFDGRDLWGADAEANTGVTVDLWERYLEPL